LFQFSAPNKGDCNPKKKEAKSMNFVSILSPQQRGLQSDYRFKRSFCRSCFNSQPPTKGTAIRLNGDMVAKSTVSILSPQQRGLQLAFGADDAIDWLVSILSPQQRGLQYW